MTWFRGNLHTHTSCSDGDSDADTVVAWYAARGYHWLAITDHNTGLPAERAAALSAAHGILVVPGNEVTGTAHVVGLNVTVNCDPRVPRRPAVQDSLQAGVDWIRAQGGVPILAHPNWGNTFGGDVIAAIRDCALFEVHNAAPDCNTFAAGGRPGTDDIWNEALARGCRLYGVGSDDAHHFKPEMFHCRHSSANGGECSTYVECETLTIAAILDALEAGRCVASAGAHPVAAGVRDGHYEVAVTDAYQGFTFSTDFIGAKGLLARVHGWQARYAIAGDEGWVRARVFCSSGRYLWTQPAWT